VGGSPLSVGGASIPIICLLDTLLFRVRVPLNIGGASYKYFNVYDTMVLNLWQADETLG
jgi:hypothetical protein